MQRAPLLAPAIAVLIAILAEQHGLAISCAVCAIVIAAASCVLHATHVASAARATAIGLLFGLAISMMRGHPPIITTERPTDRYNATVTGDMRDPGNGSESTTLAIAGIGNVRATFRAHLVAGDRLVVRGRLEPFDEPRNPGEPSMREIERDDGYVGRLAAARIITRSPPDPWDSSAWAARLRAAASARIRSCVPEPSATILAGALWGERGTLPDNVHDAFQATGTVHVLVTAGLHLGIIAALTAFILAQLGLHRIAACSLAFIAIVAYAWFSGAHLPSERAAAMIGAALFARACGARITSWNALALAAIVVAIIWPAAVESASFALSFSCLAAILLFAEPIAHLLEAVPLHERIREALALTFATQLGTWPLTAAIFSTLAPFAILANAIVVPMMALLLPGGILTLAMPAFAPCETLLLRTMQTIVETIAAIPGAHATIATPIAPVLIAYDLFAIASALALRTRRFYVGSALLAVAFAIMIVPMLIRPAHGLQIVHLDVGQADAAVIRTPNDRVILIDAGGELERGSGPVSNAERAGARIVLAYLRRSGITRIDLMILTHPHGDHVGGAFPIIEAMPVGMIFDSGQPYSGRAYRDAMEAAHSHGVPVVLARRGMRWTSGDGVTLDVLAPSMPFLADTGDDVNENSVVVMLRSHWFRELFLGDAGEASESRLLAAGDLHADVLKVGHHGSRYASTASFIAAVEPKLAIISVGRHNTFGHPALSTLDTLEAARSTILRTDRCGAITLTVQRSAATMLPCR